MCNLDYIIAVDAGIGRAALRAPNHWFTRMSRSFGIAHTRAQDGARSRVHDFAEHRRLKGFIYSYLGMNDKRLPAPLPDLVSRESVVRHPTNFAAVAPDALAALTTRGEQLMRVLLEAYCPEIGMP